MEKLSAAAGWVTFSTVRLPTGLLMVVQKNDGRTRMIPARQAAAEAAHPPRFT